MSVLRSSRTTVQRTASSLRTIAAAKGRTQHYSVVRRAGLQEVQYSVGPNRSAFFVSFYPRPHRKLCFAADAGNYDNCSCHEAHQLSSSGSHKYLDVRTPQEFEAGHVEGAVNIPIMTTNAFGMMTPNPEFINQVQSTFPNKSEQIVIGCQSGKRSAMAAEALTDAGYDALMNVEGGFAAWVGAGLPVTK